LIDFRFGIRLPDLTSSNEGKFFLAAKIWFASGFVSELKNQFPLSIKLPLM